MKGILIMNVAANGKVLLAEDARHQAPQEAMAFFMQMAVQSGNLVLGRKAYELILQNPDVRKFFDGVEIVILSGAGEAIEGYKVVETPEQAIKYLATKGHSEVIIGGGIATYNAFLQADLVTELYMNIMPVITGNGGIIGSKDDVLLQYKLAGHKLLTNDVLQLHLSKIKTAH